MEPGVGASSDAKDFADSFLSLAQSGAQAQVFRRREWSVADPNGNGLISLSECDLWIKTVLIATHGKVKGELLWKTFRPSFIHAFNRVKAVAPSKGVAGAATATTDDYVSKKEFRLLNGCLCIYANMLDAFAVIDGGSAGVDANDDRRISLKEWQAGYSKVSDHGFVALANVSDPQAVFLAMDDDGAGMVLLGEWCAYLLKAEVSARTPMGSFLALTDGKAERRVTVKVATSDISRRKRISASERSYAMSMNSVKVGGSGASGELYDFVKCFAGLAKKTLYAQLARRNAWNQADPNGNGLISLAECDRWIKKVLVEKCAKDAGESLWRLFRPSYIHAFNRAKVVAPPGLIVGAENATTDDYVSRKEFRVLCAYICIHATMFDAFARIDGGGSGEEADYNDRRISLDEFLAEYKNVENYGFVALSDISDPNAIFAEMDADKGGMVLFGEWCSYIAKTEKEAETPTGNLLGIADFKAERKRFKFEKRTKKSILQVIKGSSDEVHDFMNCFEILGQESAKARKYRRREWLAADPNGNGLISLAECDRWIKQNLISQIGRERGEGIWRLYRPSYIHAFNKAKDIAPDESIRNANATTDDYITKKEFRLLNSYLCIYANMFDAFMVIDTGRAGISNDGDRRISLEEWLEGYRMVSKHGFVALADVSDPNAAFSSMDRNGGGMVLLGEWCSYIGKAEVAAKTSVGTLLALADVKREPRRKRVKKSIIQPEMGSSEEVKTFVTCFEILGEETPEAQKIRRREWLTADPNGNGLISLAECDRWIKHTLVVQCGRERGEPIWRLFRPSFIHAFNKAKDVAPESRVKGARTATTDDYVTKTEFRLLCSYLCIYANIFDAFAVIDGGSAGVDANDDRRISLDEWVAGYKKVSKHGFVGLANISDPNAVFAEMDADGAGMVLLGEFCDYVAKAEAAALTPMGKVLVIADNKGK